MREEFRADKGLLGRIGYGDEYKWLEHIGPVDGAWPEWLWTRSDSILSQDDLQELRGISIAGFESLTKPDRNAKEDFGPRRLLLVNSVDEVTGPEIGETAYNR